MSPFQVASNPHAKAEARRCWKLGPGGVRPGCQRRAILDYVGWKWCLRHYWEMEIDNLHEYGESVWDWLGRVWVTVRHTRFVR
jgi:hypothetical protein